MPEQEIPQEVRLAHFREELKKSILANKDADQTLADVTPEYVDKLGIEAMRLWDELKRHLDTLKTLSVDEMNDTNTEAVQAYKAYVAELKQMQARSEKTEAQGAPLDSEIMQFAAWIRNQATVPSAFIGNVYDEEDLQLFRDTIDTISKKMNG